MSDEDDFNLKERLFWFGGGVLTTITGLSLISISLYVATSTPGLGPWSLTNYFQLVFGIAGTITGFLVTIVGAGITLVSLDTELEET